MQILTKFTVITLMSLYASASFAGANARDQIFDGTSEYVRIDPIDRGSNIPSVGSSLLDKLFSKKDASGKIVYDIPYPYDRFLDRLGGRPAPSPRYLTRIRRLKTVDELLHFLRNDLFIRTGEKTQDLESLFTFGRSLQKPRIGNAIINPWLSPREVSTLNLPREPHLADVGRVQARLFCGHVSDMHALECISWNDQAARFEFQVVENYGDPAKQKAVYVNRTKCTSCHQAGAPIFPKLDWLESDDNLALELGIIYSNYGGDKKELEARKDDLASAMNLRLATSLSDRQRVFDPESERFRSIKAGKFDRSVKIASDLMLANKIWIQLCGDDDKGNSCRRLIFKTYLVWLSHAADQDRDQQALDYLRSQIPLLNAPTGMSRFIPSFLRKVESNNLPEFLVNWDKLKNAKVYSPFFMDRDPLTAVFNNEDILACATGVCSLDFVKKMTTPESTNRLIWHGQEVNSFFNPRVLRESNLIEKFKTPEEALTAIALKLTIFFYRGRTTFAAGDLQTSDFGDWLKVRLARPVGLMDQILDPKLSVLFEKVDQMEDRFFGPLPISRERLLFGLWEGIDNAKAREFFNIATHGGPEKEAQSIAQIYVADRIKYPALNTVTRVCAQCHATGGGFSNLPQFAFSGSHSELVSNVFYYREAMLRQLKAHNMPPEFAPVGVTEAERAQLIDYLENMRPEAIEK